MAIKQLSDGNPSGTVMGQSTSDLIAFYGDTPVAQQAHIASATATATSARNAVNSVLTVLRNLGLIASS